MDNKDLLRDFIYESPDDRTRIERMGIAHDIINSFWPFWREQINELAKAIQSRLNEDFLEKDKWIVSAPQDIFAKYAGFTVFKGSWVQGTDSRGILSLSIAADSTWFNNLCYGVLKSNNSIPSSFFSEVTATLKNKFDGVYPESEIWVYWKWFDAYKNTDTRKFRTLWVTEKGKNELVNQLCSPLVNLKMELETIMDRSIESYIQQSKVQSEV